MHNILFLLALLLSIFMSKYILVEIFIKHPRGLIQRGFQL